jgi:hypothetical protein
MRVLFTWESKRGVTEGMAELKVRVFKGKDALPAATGTIPCGV